MLFTSTCRMNMVEFLETSISKIVMRKAKDCGDPTGT